MPLYNKIMLAVTASLLTVGCSTYSLKELRHTTPKGTAFQNSLSKLYMDFAIQEEKDYDWFSSMYFADKGLVAAYGGDVEPEKPEDWDVPADQVSKMEQARKILLQTINDKNKQAYPRLSARAVYYYDCWLEQQEENWQTEDINECRDGLADAFERLGAPDINLIPMVDPETTAPAPYIAPVKLIQDHTDEDSEDWEEHAMVHEEPVQSDGRGGPMMITEQSFNRGLVAKEQTTMGQRLAHAGAPQAPQIVSPYSASTGVETSSFMVFFDDSRTSLPNEGRKIVDEIVRLLDDESSYSVVIGASEHVEFAQKRAHSVRQRLIEGGVDGDSITVSVAQMPDFMADSDEGDGSSIRHRVEIYLNQ